MCGRSEIATGQQGLVIDICRPCAKRHEDGEEEQEEENPAQARCGKRKEQLEEEEEEERSMKDFFLKV